MLSVIFLTSFFIGLRRICLRAKVHNLVFFICSLFTGIDCVTDKLKAIFSWMKNALYCPNNYSPECLKLYSRALNFQNFPRHSPRHSPPLVKGDYWPLVNIVGYSFQTCWLLQCLKPLKKGRRGNHEHKILNRPFKPWRFSFASIFATGCSLHWKWYSVWLPGQPPVEASWKPWPSNVLTAEQLFLLVVF